MTIHYRTADKSDAAALAGIHIEGWRSTYDGIVSPHYLATLDEQAMADDWRKWLDGEHFHVIAALDEHDLPCGFVSYGKLRTPVPGMSPIRPLYTAEIYGIYILPAYWRQGIGRELMRQAASDLRTQKHRSLCLWVIKKNERAAAFYKALGGQRCGKKDITIGDRTLQEICFGWRDTAILIDV